MGLSEIFKSIATLRSTAVLLAILLMPTAATPKEGPSSADLSDLSPDTVRRELGKRVDLSRPSTPQALQDGLVEYGFVAGPGANLNSNSEEVLKAIKDLNQGFSETSLQSDLTVHTARPGARVRYRLIGQTDSMQFNQLTNQAEDKIPIGLYFVWSERGGRPTSSETAKFRIIQAKTRVDLEESGQ
jgi:hypothetical protein